MQPDSTVHPLAIDAEGRYSNFFKIGYTAFEFLLDFGQVYTDSGADNVHTRIVTTPQYAKALAELLTAVHTALRELAEVITATQPESARTCRSEASARMKMTGVIAAPARHSAL